MTNVAHLLSYLPIILSLYVKIKAPHMKWLGFLLIFLCCYNFEQGQFSLKLIFMFLMGVFLVCGKSLMDHLFFIERQKVRSQYRMKR